MEEEELKQRTWSAGLEKAKARRRSRSHCLSRLGVVKYGRHRWVLLVGSITVDSPKDDQQSEGSYRTVYIISGLLLVPLSLALSVFLGWHVHLILQNKTTIEVFLPEYASFYSILFSGVLSFQVITN
ncbi:hypothetical protein HAX54_020537 [Datura stramonium]|uniref:Protein S-acyltransferase n=1 Tax=Datura stramonium TaxID=4076 RepID=A0ABS8Y774_DATST|nr:hypothetical protein [Datura stramonium]